MDSGPDGAVFMGFPVFWGSLADDVKPGDPKGWYQVERGKRKYRVADGTGEKFNLVERFSPATFGHVEARTVTAGVTEEPPHIQQATREWDRGSRTLVVSLVLEGASTRGTTSGAAPTSVKAAAAESAERAYSHGLIDDIEKIGWRLEHMSTVVRQLGEASRDKFLSSGQNVVAFNEIWGTFMFRREIGA